MIGGSRGGNGLGKGGDWEWKRGRDGLTLLVCSGAVIFDQAIH